MGSTTILVTYMAVLLVAETKDLEGSHANLSTRDPDDTFFPGKFPST